ncbi:MAG TPA: YihY/virulence factor BrkB family protein [Bryobacteraceae bacterium]|nr:YihY/virulence factor BrkB family protein [Bryobacteraceae bacterium]
MPTQPSLYIERSGPLIRFWGLFRQACVAAYEDNCFGTAKGAAYSALLAFFPVLASITAILAQVNAESVAGVLYRFLFQIVPPGSEDLVLAQFAVKTQRPVWLISAAAVLSAWAASGAMMSLMEGFQAAYRLPSGRPFVKQRGVALLLVFIAAVPAVGSSALILFGVRTERSVLGWLGLLPSEDLKSWVILVSSLIRYLIALAATVLVTALLYCVGPNRPLRLRTVWPGAILATFLWLAATSGFAWYVRNIANYSVLYGSIGAVIALLVWMYLLSLITLVGCEYNAVRERVAAEF